MLNWDMAPVSINAAKHITANLYYVPSVAAAGGSSCDGSLVGSSDIWVRFSGAGGTQLATSAPGTNQYGTQASGWYSTSLPASGATVNGTVCFQWNSNTCNWNIL